MAKRDAKAAKMQSRRVTPKGTKPGPTPPASNRYTPPTPDIKRPSPRWVPILMFSLFAIGMLVIVLNYFAVLPGEVKNGYLMLGLAFITGGFITATQYR